ncbi:MAG: hypothetical protein FWE12_07295 [Oscillospiraceae bacterium]|nr:hypothetical protein [Oscillospiraceae bacterium]
MANRKRQLLVLSAALLVLLSAVIAFLPNSAPARQPNLSPISEFDPQLIQLSQLGANLRPLLHERADMSAEERQRIVENRDMLIDLQIFRLGTSVYVRQWSTHGLSALPLGTRLDDIDSRQSLAPFVRPGTGEVYFPALFFPQSEFARDFLNATLTLQSTPPLTIVFRLPEDDGDGWLLYRNHLFLSQATVEAHSDYQITRLGDFLIVAPEDRTIDETALLPLIEQIFADV